MWLGSQDLVMRVRPLNVVKDDLEERFALSLFFMLGREKKRIYFEVSKFTFVDCIVVTNASCLIKIRWVMFLLCIYFLFIEIIYQPSDLNPTANIE